MPVFSYIAKSRQGFDLSGLLEANILEEAISVLHKKDLIVISVKEKNVKKFREKSVALDDLAIFSRELASMLGAGITLVRALRILGEQTENRNLAIVCTKMKEEILAGSSFYDAIRKYPRIFSALYVNMVRSGEVSGALNEILFMVAAHLEKSANLQRKVRTAMVYPIVVVSMATIITSVLLIKVVPTFEGIFRSLGGELPLPTKILIMISTCVRKSFLIVIGIFFIFSVWFKKYTGTPQGRYWLDKNLLKLPVFGPFLKKVAITRFASTLSILIKSAVPLLNSLDIVGKASGNKIVEESVNNTIRGVRHGESIAGELAKGGIFPPMVTGMIGIGENTGQLPEMLTTISDLYDQHIEATVGSLTAMLEPLVIGFLGIVVGGIVISLFLPIFKISQLIH